MRLPCRQLQQRDRMRRVPILPRQQHPGVRVPRWLHLRRLCVRLQRRVLRHGAQLHRVPRWVQHGVHGFNEREPVCLCPRLLPERDRVRGVQDVRQRLRGRAVSRRGHERRVHVQVQRRVLPERDDVLGVQDVLCQRVPVCHVPPGLRLGRLCVPVQRRVLRHGA